MQVEQQDRSSPGRKVVRSRTTGGSCPHNDRVVTFHCLRDRLNPVC